MTCKDTLILLTASLLLAVTSCGDGKEKPVSEGEVLVSVGDSSLMLQDVLLRIPRGLTPEDSSAMFRRLVDGWVESMVLTDIAGENAPDLDRIEEMVSAYRNSLIVESYLRRMDEGSAPKVSEEAVRDYYGRHGAEMVLEAPLIKGVYIKTADKDARIDDIRRWMETGTEASIDNLEKYGMRLASQYEYFADQWVEWNAVAEQIPYRFYDADAFLQSTRNFETSYGGSTYFLHIYDYVPTGQPMPREYAEKRIRTILDNRNSAAYRTQLLRRIYRRKIKEEVLRPGLYDPLEGEMRGAAASTDKKK